MTRRCDAIVIGGGPGGATAALRLARHGRDAIVLEKAGFPRFHVGESFLPRNRQLIDDLGLTERLAAIPQIRKLGVEVGFGHALTPMQHIDFSLSLTRGEKEAFNIARAPFDAMLLDAAREAGVEVRENDPVTEIIRLEDGDVAVRTKQGVVEGRWLIDASGQSTVVARHLGTRRLVDHLRKVAYFSHFEGVHRRRDQYAGYGTVVICDEGWFWIIPIDETRTSVGLVIDADVARNVNVPANEMLAWGLQRCPVMAERMKNASGPRDNHVVADFTYNCDPFAGPGHFLVGDSATFLDPVFSTGVCVAMMSAVDAADGINDLIMGRARPATVRRRYIKELKKQSGVFYRLVNDFYDHSFRELLVNGTGPLGMHRALIAMLGGHVYPRVSLAIRWRYAAFRMAMFINRHHQLVPAQERFSLLDAPPIDVALPDREAVLAYN